MEYSTTEWLNARALIACAEFDAGASLMVRYSHQCDGTRWFDVLGAYPRHGRYPLAERPIAYPEHHLAHIGKHHKLPA